MKKLCIAIFMITAVSCVSQSTISTDSGNKYFSEATQIIEKNELVELETRKYSKDTVKQKFILIKPNNPVASVILFEGAMGDIDLEIVDGSPQPTYLKIGFLNRNRKLFAQHGLMVALVDVPSDKPEGLNQVDRIGERHRQDIKAVISYLKKEADLPVWVMSMSNSTLSAANMAINLQDEVTGAVFASARITFPTKWKPITKKLPGGVIAVAKDIKVPTLIVHHINDKCKNTPLYRVKQMKRSMVNCPKVELILFSGGRIPESQPCHALSQHGFYGIENRVIENVAGFIKENS
jgi:hypothetical protein